MKTNFKNLITGAVVASAMVLTMGCVKDTTEDVQHNQMIGSEGERIALTIETSRLEQNGFNISFVEGDVININGEHCPVVTDENGDLAVYPLESLDGIYRATYPATASDPYWLGNEAIYIHSNMQRYASTGFGVDAMPLAAYLDATSGTTALKFNAMMGVLRLTIKGNAEIRSIRIKDNNLTTLTGSSCYAYAMAGYCNAVSGTTVQGQLFDDTTTHFAPSTNATGLCPTITLLCNDGDGKGVQLSAAGTTFDIVVPARAYTKGFTVSVSSNDHLNQTLATSGSTTVNTNEITVMQPFTYAPDSNLLFAENFDAMVYGSDIVTYRAAGSTAGFWRGRTPNPANSAKCTNGLPATGENDGLTPGIYYGTNATGTNYAGSSVAISTPGICYSNWVDVPATNASMENVKATSGALFASESLLRIRNMWDWFIARAVEYDGYISVGAGTASINTYTLGIYPRGTVMTPPFSKIVGNQDIAVTFKIAGDDISMGENLYIYNSGGGFISNVCFIDASGNEVSAGYNSKKWASVSQTCWACSASALSLTEWRRVRVVISGADSTTAVRFFSNSAADKRSTAYFIDDIEVRKYEAGQTASTTVKGTVSCGGVGIAGVVVSDGTNVTRTNSSGQYFLPTKVSTAKHVFISIPSGYEMTSRSSINGTTPAFFQTVSNTSGVQTKNFTLKAVDQSSYVVLTIADSHVLDYTGYTSGSTTDKSDYNNKFMPFWNTYAASFDVPVYGIHLGDMVQYTAVKNNAYKLANYVADTKESPCPIFNTMGNHDHINVSTTLTDSNQDNSRTQWLSSMGPAFYSFNIGTEHYVVLDNMFILTGETDYEAKVDAKQIAWLKQDLALIDTNVIKGIVICVHCPMISDWGIIGDGYKPLFAELGSLPVTVLSGHSHNDHTVRATNSENGLGTSVYEFTTPSLAGTAWLTELTVDGVPRSIVQHTFSAGRPATRKFIPFDSKYEAEGTAHARYYTTSTYKPSNFGSDAAAYKLTPYAGTARYRSEEITPENTDANSYGTDKVIIVNAWGSYSVTFQATNNAAGKTYKGRTDLAYRDWFWTSYNSSDRNSINASANDNQGPAHQLPRTNCQHIHVFKPSAETDRIRIKMFDVNGTQIGATKLMTAE